MTKPTVTQNLMRMLDLSPVEATPASFGSDEVSTGVTLTREQPRTFRWSGSCPVDYCRRPHGGGQGHPLDSRLFSAPRRY